MKVNTVNTNSQNCNFKANVSERFINRATEFCKKSGKQDLYTRFIQNVERFKNYGSDNVTVYYSKKNINGKDMHVLTAVDDSLIPAKRIILTSKDLFRKVIDKFSRINEYEFNVKMNK